jgi:regulator of sigma E protease
MQATARHKGSPIGVEALGLAYGINPQVQSVEAGGPAERQGLQAGDILTQAVFRPAGDDPETAKMVRSLSPLPIDRENDNWPWIASLLQELPGRLHLELFFRRGDVTNFVELTPVASRTLFDPERGIALAPLPGMRQAHTLPEALALGLRETKEGIMQVFIVLRRLKDSYSSLGGPVTIATAATMEASESLARLLVFLTLLSANLAVINFLPIPVLDGGHMMFLTYEGLFGKPDNERLAFGLTLLGLSFILCPQRGGTERSWSLALCFRGVLLHRSSDGVTKYLWPLPRPPPLAAE